MKKMLLLVFFAFGVSLAKAQYTNTKIEVGQQAPELEFNNPEDQPLKLSEINQNRIVLLDFWASWCGPCRMSSPALVKMFTTYNHKKFKKAKKGFTVVSVSLDKDKAPWIEAIKADNYSWSYHMSDLKGWGSKAADIYGVAFVPQCFLIDETGMVLGKYMKADEVEEDLKKLLKK